MKELVNYLNNTIEKSNELCEYFTFNSMMSKVINRAIKNNDSRMLICILKDFSIQHESTLYIIGREEKNFNNDTKAAYQAKVDAMVALQAKVAEFVKGQDTELY